MDDLAYSFFIEKQNGIAKKVISYDNFNCKFPNVCGVDVSYRNNNACASAVILNIDTFKVIETVTSKTIIKYPYISGLFMLREGVPILHTLKLLENSFDILLIDGNGLLHPRKCGLACYIGITIDKSTIGVAKSLLCGHLMNDNYIEYYGRNLGYRISNKNKKEIYVSVGHKFSLDSAIGLVVKLIKSGEWYPEPLRIAHINSKNYYNFS